MDAPPPSAEEEEEEAAASGPYVLHVFPFSVFSLMVRLTVALGCETVGAGGRVPRMVTRLVNLHREENLDEAYLLGVNPKGQVPALTDGPLPHPLTDSVEISLHFCDHFFPVMLGGLHQRSVSELLAELHSIQPLSLSLPHDNNSSADTVSLPRVDRLLANPSISSSYRRALQYKKKFHDANLGKALTYQSIRQAEERTRAFFQKLVGLLAYNNDSLWLFGDAIGPTILDAHATPFIARLMEWQRNDLVPYSMQAYARRIMALPEWRAITSGRPTLWNVAIGDVTMLDSI